MIPDKTFLRGCAARNSRSLPPELEDWLIVHFEDEPYEGFNSAPGLECMVCIYCDSYAQGRLDVTIPDPLTRLRERCESLKDCIFGLRLDLHEAERQCEEYRRILREHHLL